MEQSAELHPELNPEVGVSRCSQMEANRKLYIMKKKKKVLAGSRSAEEAFSDQSLGLATLVHLNSSIEIFFWTSPYSLALGLIKGS